MHQHSIPQFGAHCRMNHQVSWYELNCINTDSYATVGVGAGTVTDWLEEREKSCDNSDFELDCLLLFVQVWI